MFESGNVDSFKEKVNVDHEIDIGELGKETERVFDEKNQDSLVEVGRDLGMETERVSAPIQREENVNKIDEEIMKMEINDDKKIDMNVVEKVGDLVMVTERVADDLLQVNNESEGNKGKVKDNEVVLKDVGKRKRKKQQRKRLNAKKKRKMSKKQEIEAKAEFEKLFEKIKYAKEVFESYRK